jgi:hypothetical protein
MSDFIRFYEPIHVHPEGKLPPDRKESATPLEHIYAYRSWQSECEEVDLDEVNLSREVSDFFLNLAIEQKKKRALTEN